MRIRPGGGLGRPDAARCVLRDEFEFTFDEPPSD
jgi:hypothetical protein